MRKFYSIFLYVVYRLMKATWRYDVQLDETARRAMDDPSQFKVFAHFHEDEWGLMPPFSGMGMHVLISMSEDGSLMTSLVERIGYRVTRGSSSKNAVGGLLSLIRTLRKSESRMLSLAIDGPKGPRRKVKAGILKIAEATGAQVIATSGYCSNPLIFRKAWSHGYLPKPFSKIVVRGLAFESAEYVKKAHKEDRVEQLSAELEQKLLAAKSLAKEALR